MEIKMSVDRIATCVAICYDDNDNKYEIPLSLTELKIGDVISVVFNGENTPVSATVLKEETKKRKSSLAKRTKNLFNRNKNE